MKRILIGHRGVGKSSVLKRHSRYFSDIPHFDLDKEIEMRLGKTVSQIFLEKGESYFRDLEKKIYVELIQNKNYVIAVGGGFDPLFISTDNEIIWIRRQTDKDGRLFLNRPRLDKTVTALQESLQLYKKRTPFFEKVANWVYDVPEGIDLSVKAQHIEEAIFKGQDQIGGYLSLFPQHKCIIDQMIGIELRTDVWTLDQIDDLIQQYSHQKNMIVSWRTKENSHSKIYPSNVRIDEALENGHPRYLDIISLHDCKTISEGIQRLESYQACQYKFSPLVDSFADLIAGYRWQQERPKERSFLPRSQTGRWQWFRRYMIDKQDINFIRQNQSIDDQPVIFDVLADQKQKHKNQFLAVLGSPVHHSQSPLLHFDHIESSFYKIDIQKEELLQALPFLSDLGLIAAAVTSPLKNIMAELINSNQTQEVNSIVKNKDHKWEGTSTDDLGFKKLIQSSTQYDDQISIWGGQGVLPALLKIRNDVVCYSSRTGQLKHGASIKDNPDILVWAAPRTLDTQFPFQFDLKWSPRVVVDLNYTDSSMGLEYAQSIGCQYVSGLEMLKEQGYHQRCFWKKIQENI